MAGTESFASGGEPALAPALAVGDLVGGVYRIERLLGEGGGGAVYLARHVGLDGARFALKVLREAPERGADLLLREGRLAAEVRSAHVVKVAAIGRLDGGAPYLVMEYVEGPTLDQLLAERELGVDEAIGCVRQLCLALEAAHDKGLVHGDVSLRNVFVTPQPDGSLHVQLGDFGLARRVRKETSATVSVELGTARGTPRFMAPETITGQDAVDERSDVFSVGVLLHRLLAGSFPFDGPTTHEILGAVLRGAPPPLPDRRPDGAVDARRDLSPLGPVVARCLAPQPSARYPDARALREALEAPPPIERRAQAPIAIPRRRTRIAVAAGAVVLVGLGAFASYEQWRDHAAIPFGVALECPDTTGALPELDADVRHAIARATCARVGAGLDVDWGGGPDATPLATRLERDPRGGFRLLVDVAGRRETGRGETPFLALHDAARRLLARAERPPLSAEEIRAWGAADAENAAAERAVWRRRTALVIEDYEQEPRAVVARDPELPFAQLLLAEVERDPARVREARERANAAAERLPPVRAAAVRASIAAHLHPDSADALEALRSAYNAAPDDPDIGVLYVKALVEAGRGDTAHGVAERMRARFPRRALLAGHYLDALPRQVAGEDARMVEWLDEELPEQRAATPNVCMLVETGRLEEADAALAFARRLGVPEERIAIPETVVALATGDPTRIERATAAHSGSTLAWSQQTGARLRFAGMLLRGQVAAAERYLQSEIASGQAAGDEPRTVAYVASSLRLSRLAGGPRLGLDELERLAPASAQAKLTLGGQVAARAELSLARAQASGGAARATAEVALRELDEAIERRAGADPVQLAAARLRTLPLARLARGDEEVAARWRASSTAWLSDRVAAAYDAALALQAIGATDDAERAYRLAADPFDIDRHPLESIAARIRLADLLEASGHAEAALPLRAHVDRAWAGADEGLRERVRAAR